MKGRYKLNHEQWVCLQRKRRRQGIWGKQNDQAGGEDDMLCGVESD